MLPSSHVLVPLKLHQVLVQLQSGDKEQDFPLSPVQVSIGVQLWRLPGCHEFLAALGESGRTPSAGVSIRTVEDPVKTGPRIGDRTSAARATV